MHVETVDLWPRRTDELKFERVHAHLRGVGRTADMGEAELKELLTHMEEENLVMHRIGIVFLI